MMTRILFWRTPKISKLLEHLQQLFQIDYKVKFSSFYGILVLQQLLQNESFLTIRYSELSYMKVTVAPAKYYFILFSLSPSREKYKISPCGLPDLQFTPCGIKTNLKVPMVCTKKKKTI
jgi:hypothetical protein